MRNFKPLIALAAAAAFVPAIAVGQQRTSDSSKKSPEQVKINVIEREPSSITLRAMTSSGTTIATMHVACDQKPSALIEWRTDLLNKGPYDREWKVVEIGGDGKRKSFNRGDASLDRGGMIITPSVKNSSASAVFTPEAICGKSPNGDAAKANLADTLKAVFGSRYVIR